VLRIAYLADFYDACRSARVYRPGPIPREEVLERVRQGRGTDFDPQIAYAFQRSLSQVAEVEESSDHAWKQPAFAFPLLLVLLLVLVAALLRLSLPSGRVLHTSFSARSRPGASWGRPWLEVSGTGT